MHISNFDIFEDETNKIFQIRTKDDIMLVEFQGSEEEQIFKDLIKHFSNDNYNIPELFTEFSSKFPKEKVLKIFADLKEAELIEEYDPASANVNGQDSPHQEKSFDELLKEKIKDTHLALIGGKTILQRLESKAQLSGYEEINTLEVTPEIKDEEVIAMIDDNDFLIVDAEEWNPYFLELINKTALEKVKPWILVRGVNQSRGSVGPLFYGRETGCYHCLISRVKSQHEFLPYLETYEDHLRIRKRSAKVNSDDPNLQVVYDMLASLAILEANKFVSEVAVPEVYGRYVSIDIHSYNLQKNVLLKSPLCPVCKPTTDYSLAPWLEPVMLRNTYVESKTTQQEEMADAPQ